MSKLRISLVQMNVLPSDKEGNLRKIAYFANKAAENKSAIICFPELSTCGYERDFPGILAEEIPGHTSRKLLEMSRENGITIVSGMIEREKNNLYITQIVASSNGSMGKYRKTHLGKQEKKVFCPGEELPVFEIDDIELNQIAFGIGICYDLHFPEVVTCFSLQGAQIVFAPHASPLTAEKRLEIWNRYMGARAYDNRVYIAACNLTGNNGNIDFGGGMGIWGPWGNLVKEYKGKDENMVFYDLDMEELNDMRKNEREDMKTPFYLKKRRPDLYSKYM